MRGTRSDLNSISIMDEDKVEEYKHIVVDLDNRLDWTILMLLTRTDRADFNT